VHGTAKQADDPINTAGVIHAVRGNSDLPARAWGAASTPPSAPHSPRACRLSAVPTRFDQCGISRHHPKSKKCPSRSPGPRCDSCKVDLRRNHQNNHWREADVEVRTAHSGASRMKTIRSIGCRSIAAQRRGRTSAPPEGAVGLLLHTTFNQITTFAKSIRARLADLARSWRLPEACSRPQRNRLHQNRLDPTEL